MSTIREVWRDIMQIGQNEEDTIDVFFTNVCILP